MAANKSQGSYYTLFLVAATVLCAGIYEFSSGFGKLLLLVGAVALVGSLFGMMGIKSQEGKTATPASAMSMKLLGAAAAALGWVITLFGMHITPSTGGRIVLALVGIAVSLFGIIVILPAAFNKHAIWKS
ncbi:MAG TPA: hypothetical protein VHX36_05245 [Candidatus Acidoferrales bacterium]|jgi:hypothetical protein|nr:hypothetical protein [Candidatus Acidoferrales bacterium]